MIINDSGSRKNISRMMRQTQDRGCHRDMGAECKGGGARLAQGSAGRVGARVGLKGQGGGRVAPRVRLQTRQRKPFDLRLELVALSQ